MNHIDTLDERIIAALQENGRLTMKALAEHVGLSSPAMIERVRRLEERGVIAGYRAIITPAAIGRPITAIINAEVDYQSIPGFIEMIQNDQSVVEAHRTTGASNFLLKVHVADTDALEELVDELSSTGARCEASLVLSSPVSWRSLTAPEGTVRPRSRLSRRRGERLREVAATERKPVVKRPAARRRKAATT